MSFTIKGTYTKNRGDQAASGTVEVFSKRGVSLDDATLDEDGSYSLTIDAEEGEIRIVETLDGVEERSYPVSVSRGSTTDTSRDIGYIGPVAQSGASVSPVDRLSLFKTPTVDSDTWTEIDWTGAQEFDSTGDSISVVDGALTVAEGTYAVSVRASFGEGAGTFRLLFLGDDLSPVTGPTVTAAPVTGDPTQLGTSLTWRFPDNDPIRVAVRHDDPGALAVGVWMFVQRLA